MPRPKTALRCVAFLLLLWPAATTLRSAALQGSSADLAGTCPCTQLKKIPTKRTMRPEPCDPPASDRQSACASPASQTDGSCDKPAGNTIEPPKVTAEGSNQAIATGAQPTQPRRRPTISGVVQGRAAPGQRVRITVSDFNPQADALWVNNARVDPALITGPDPEGKSDYDGPLSFEIPANSKTANPPEGCPAGTINLSRPRVRIAAATATCPPSGNHAGASLDVSAKATFWQFRFVGLSLSLLAVAILAWLLASLTGLRWRWSAQSRWIIDDETKSYSLQRVQFLGWTAAAVFAYLYVFYSLFFAQGITEFPVLPVSLIKLLGISAGTSLLAHGVNALKGPEGSGASGPKLRDLITAGEVIALDKVQLLVWTLVGWVTFLLAIGSRAPGNLSHNIPELPDALWQLAGLSGAIYLGGKAVRGAGPVLRQVHAVWQTAGTPGLQIELRGLNLSQDGIFSLCLPGRDYEKIPFNRITGLPQPGLPKITVPGDTPADRLVRGLSFELSVSDQDPFAGLLKLDRNAKLILRVENPDGQRAECEFTIGES